MSKLYVIRCEHTGLCKIGFSSSPKSRLKSIISSSGFNCTLEFQSENLTNAPFCEKQAHSICGGRKIGEWFECSIDEAIKSVEKSVASFSGGHSKKSRQSIKMVDRGSSVNLSDDERGRYAELFSLWAINKSKPEDVIKMALDLFQEKMPEQALLICSSVYSGQSGDSTSPFKDRLDVQCFYNQLMTAAL